MADGHVYVGLQGRDITPRDLWEKGENQLCHSLNHIFMRITPLFENQNFTYIIYAQLPTSVINNHNFFLFQ